MIHGSRAARRGRIYFEQPTKPDPASEQSALHRRLFAHDVPASEFYQSVLLALAACIAVGCSKGDRYTGTAQVTGKVTYNGQPLAGAVVTFIGDAGETPEAGMSSEDGAYDLRVKPGNYTATVSKLTAPASAKVAVSMEEAMSNARAPVEEPKETLPTKYQSRTESPLKVEVGAGGSNVHDLSLSG
jgi:hypothetical protein